MPAIYKLLFKTKIKFMHRVKIQNKDLVDK